MYVEYFRGTRWIHYCWHYTTQEPVLELPGVIPQPNESVWMVPNTVEID